MLNVIDENTCEASAIVADPSFDADRAVATPRWLAIERGWAARVRTVRNGLKTRIELGHRLVRRDQDAWIDLFNFRFCCELLNLWQLDSPLQAQVLIEDWRVDYNTNRHHSALNNLTPAQFYQNRTIRSQPPQRPDHKQGTAQRGESSPS
ncbi:MAG: integrase core domain-containing protein [Pseudomonadota bacterium]